MKIGLLSTIDTNIGDDFIRCGITHVIEGLRRGRDVEYVVINKHKPDSVQFKWQLPLKRFTDYRPRTWPLRAWIRNNCPWFAWSRFDPCDLLIQCGAPVLWNGCGHSEWATPIWRDVLNRLSQQGKPVLNIGGGATYAWENRPETLRGDADEDFVRLMLQSCCLTTARDRLSQRLFSSLGYDVEVLCCPAILAGQAYTEPTAATRKVVVNYMEGGGHFDWGQGIDKTHWQDTMSEVVRALHSQGWQVVLLAHDAKEHELARRIWPEYRCERPDTLESYFTFIRDAAFGVFNRMHASVAAAGLGVPSVAVGTDARNLMVAETELPVFYVKETTPEGLLRETQRLVDRRQSEGNRLLDLRAKTQRRYEELLAPFVLP